MNPFIIAAWLACQSLDAVTTEIAIKHYNGVEMNPFMQKARFPIRIGVNLLGILVYRKTKTKVVPSVAIATGCAAGTWNILQMVK